MTGSASLPGGSAPRATLRRDARVLARAREPRVEHPLADLPLLEAVELDRERVVDLVGVSRRR